MGSPLGPALANIFAGFRKSGISDNTVKPGVYFQCVDDTFVIIGFELDCDHFQETLKLIHPALKFTVEKEENNSLNFLDILVGNRVLDFLLAFIGNQHLQKNTSVGIPLPQRQRLALLKP